MFYLVTASGGHWGSGHLQRCHYLRDEVLEPSSVPSLIFNLPEFPERPSAKASVLGTPPVAGADSIWSTLASLDEYRPGPGSVVLLDRRDTVPVQQACPVVCFDNYSRFDEHRAWQKDDLNEFIHGGRFEELAGQAGLIFIFSLPDQRWVDRAGEHLFHNVWWSYNDGRLFICSAGLMALNPALYNTAGEDAGVNSDWLVYLGGLNEERCRALIRRLKVPAGSTIVWPHLDRDLVRAYMGCVHLDREIVTPEHYIKLMRSHGAVAGYYGLGAWEAVAMGKPFYHIPVSMTHHHLARCLNKTGTGFELPAINRTTTVQPGSVFNNPYGLYKKIVAILQQKGK